MVEENITLVVSVDTKVTKLKDSVYLLNIHQLYEGSTYSRMEGEYYLLSPFLVL